MRLQNRNQIAYLGALALLFSYAEMILPRFVPFLRLGLGNIPILLALNLSFPSFLILELLKSFAACLTAGTLFSPFLIISVAQSLASGILMYGLNKIKGGWISLYGISILGSAASSIVQLFLSALYLGRGTYSFAGIMLLFSIFSGIATAFAASKIELKSEYNYRSLDESISLNHSESPQNKLSFVKKYAKFLKLFFILAAVILVFMNQNMHIACGFVLLAFIFQKISGRRLLLLPYLGLWLFVIISCIISPAGRVLFEFHGFTITKTALEIGILKALKLTAAASLSQTAAGIKFSTNTLVGLTLAYFNQLCQTFKNTPGNIFTKIKTMLQ
ncbi:MAG: Gx transporter family protein [Treponema sp.]|nr:Gx transporter family protein [Candidatus Treponema equifaecale]